MALATAGITASIIIVIYVLAYVFYGKKLLEQKVVRADPTRKTPALAKFDGVDYVPANKYVLYGHHFASIAGAGPIVGPAIAMAYGWLLPIIWVLFGNVFIGAVHDYLALMASVRHGGVSIMSVSENVMGRKARYIFLAYVYAALILVIGAFLSVAAKVLAGTPEAATVAMIYMPLAVMLGILMYRTGLGTVKSTAIIALILVLGIAYAMKYPFYLPTISFLGFTIDSYHFWVILLAAYAFVASVLPVWYLLQPRDYLNAYLLWSFVIISLIGVLGVFTYKFSAPAYTSFAPKIFVGVETPFWPAIVLIIACGALSGFHSVVASGTTSKQLANELDALLVGYGGMLTEGAVSSFAVIIPIALAWSQPDFPKLLEAAGKANLIPDYQEGGILALDKVQRFIYGYGYMVGKAFGSLDTVGKVMASFAAVALASFILTTLDTATRLARFAWQEMFDWLEERSRSAYKLIANRYSASFIAAAIGFVLAYPYVMIGGKLQPAYNIIWPAFAGTNQLLAALALLTSALWVYAILKVRGKVTWLIQVPAWFLWITVTVALFWWLVYVAPKYPPIQKYGAGSIVAISLALDLVLLYLFVRGLQMIKKQAGTQPA
ncbi:carbon starvation protein A [Hyperthermus butylicus]|uniref:Carbon starvation protein n=1 Tax=Hyperthermus butylicus (strain DSM 5456 / JCM 9403 / PLM1-5) TaxID=415426 RepID=A2BL01_HYPBU|nr:carbon starvation protein A [Hyperthermus butylicus]ABM80662.1 Carbon starvation protein [Hyperthermus butylicus DSM 5456]